jgi:hypothetical protein
VADNPAAGPPAGPPAGGAPKLGGKLTGSIKRHPWLTAATAAGAGVVLYLVIKSHSSSGASGGAQTLPVSYTTEDGPDETELEAQLASLQTQLANFSIQQSGQPPPVVSVPPNMPVPGAPAKRPGVPPVRPNPGGKVVKPPKKKPKVFKPKPKKGKVPV